MKIDGDKIINELTEKWKNKNCPYCNGEWLVNEKLYKLSEYKEVFLYDKSIIPLITITCNNCGNTVLVNPLVLGLIKNI